jgi:hypothetical protein
VPAYNVMDSYSHTPQVVSRMPSVAFYFFVSMPVVTFRKLSADTDGSCQVKISRGTVPSQTSRMKPGSAVRLVRHSGNFSWCSSRLHCHWHLET